MTPIDKKRMNYLSFFKDGVADAYCMAIEMKPNYFQPTTNKVMILV